MKNAELKDWTKGQRIEATKDGRTFGGFFNGFMEVDAKFAAKFPIEKRAQLTIEEDGPGMSAGTKGYSSLINQGWELRAV